MPAASHLRWFKVDKFGGLWTSGEKLLMPPEAAQVMSGCSPQPGGGLRAFFRPVLLADSAGLAEIPDFNHSISGFGVLNYSSDGAPLVIVMLHKPAGDGDFLQQRMAQWPVVASESEFERRWQHVTNGAAFDGVDENSGLGIRTGKGARHVASVSGATLGADVGQWFQNALGGFGGGYREGYEGGYGSDFGAGLYQIVVTPGATPSNIALVRHAGLSGAESEDLGPIIAHQNRLVMAAKNGLMFTSPGLYDFPADIGAGENWLALSSGAYDRPESHPAWLLSIPPSDLLVANHRGDLYNIQGDLADPTVRELSRSLVSLPHLPTNTAYGPVIILPNGGPAILGFDGSTQPLANGLDQKVWFVDDSLGFFGSLDYINHLLFSPNQHTGDDRLSNGVLVYDFRSQAWFTSAHPDLISCPNPRFLFVEGARKDGGVVMFTGAQIDGVSPGVPVMVRHPILSEEQDRAEIWEWVSSPLRDPDGNQVGVQQVQVATKGFGDTATLTLTLTNNHGDTVTYIHDVPEGTANIVIPLMMTGEYVEIGVKAESNEPGVEAPMMDFIRAGWTPQGMTAVVPAGGFRGGFAEGF
jgi:hypothetical protein